MLPEALRARRSAPRGNPSSPHAEGREARAALDRARDMAAEVLGTGTRELVFCSSGTEAVNLALFGAARRLPPGRSVVTWTAEHQSALGAVRQLQLEGRPLDLLSVDGGCLADPADIPERAGLISIGLANNEVGAIQPVAAIAAQARQLGAVLHVDCCQGPRWLEPPIGECDLASFSGHKLGAGGGGLLVVRDTVRIDPLLLGGPQEWQKRAGHLEVGQAVAVASALDITSRERQRRASVARHQSSLLRGALEAAGGRPVAVRPVLPNFACATFPGRRGEDLLLALDLAGIAVSSGAACAAGSIDPSHVLLAMGYSLDEAASGLRISTGYDTVSEQVDRVVRLLPNLIGHRAAARG